MMGDEIEYDANNMQTVDSEKETFIHHSSPSEFYPGTQYKQKIVWKNVVGFILMHVLAVYGIYLEICGHIQKKTMFLSEYKITFLIRWSVNIVSSNFRFSHQICLEF